MINFFNSKKACPNYLTKLTYILILRNYHSLFFAKAFFPWIPGTLIFTYLVIVFSCFKCVNVQTKKIKKKTYRWPIFGPFSQFLGKNYFSRNSGCLAQLHIGFQHPAKIQKKLMTQFQENARTDGRSEGRKDGQTLFYIQDPSGYRQGFNMTKSSREIQ